MLAGPQTASRGGRAVVVGMLAVIVLLAWTYLVVLANAMDDMGSALAMPMTSEWTTRDWLFMSGMWIVMMAGMMLPSAAPMIVAYRGFNAGPRSTTSFVTGYVTIWSAFALTGAAAQWQLHDLALITPMGTAGSDILAGTLLIGAGLYQFTPVKLACLNRCRTPLGFLLTEWRDGRRGGLVMGIRHGAFCLGCCWALMVLLFVMGVMNLVWVALLALAVLVEKLAPAGRLLGSAAGAGFVAWGLALLVL